LKVSLGRMDKIMKGTKIPEKEGLVMKLLEE
jgi:hypothetical protein